jgi:hypothetical protein
MFITREISEEVHGSSQKNINLQLATLIAKKLTVKEQNANAQKDLINKQKDKRRLPNVTSENKQITPKDIKTFLKENNLTE